MAGLQFNVFYVLKTRVKLQDFKTILAAIHVLFKKS